MEHPPIETILAKLTVAIEAVQSSLSWIAVWTFCIALGTCSGAGV